MVSLCFVVAADVIVEAVNSTQIIFYCDIILYKLNELFFFVNKFSISVNYCYSIYQVIRILIYYTCKMIKLDYDVLVTRYDSIFFFS